MMCMDRGGGGGSDTGLYDMATGLGVGSTGRPDELT